MSFQARAQETCRLGSWPHHDAEIRHFYPPGFSPGHLVLANIGGMLQFFTKMTSNNVVGHLGGWAGLCSEWTKALATPFTDPALLPAWFLTWVCGACKHWCHAAVCHKDDVQQCCLSFGGLGGSLLQALCGFDSSKFNCCFQKLVLPLSPRVFRQNQLQHLITPTVQWIEARGLLRLLFLFWWLMCDFRQVGE